MPADPQRLGLTARIAMLVVAVEILAFGAFGGFYIAHHTRTTDEQLRARLQLVGDMIASEELSLGSVARPALLSGLLGAEYLEGALIGRDGHVIVASDMSTMGFAIQSLADFDPRWLAKDAPQQIWISAPGRLTSVQHIHDSEDDSHRYTLVMRISTAAIDAQKDAIVQRGLLASSLFILLSSGGIILIARRLIARRVDDSLAVLKTIEAGDYSARIRVTSEDELGQLQLGINSMMAKFQSMLAELQNKKQELKDSEQLLRRAQSVAKLGSWHLDPVGLQLNWSDETRQIFGRSAGTPIAYADFIEQVHPDDRLAVETAWKSALKGNPYDITHRIVVAGEIRWIREMAELGFDAQGRLTAAIGTVQDITAQQFAVERQRESDLLLRSAIDTIGEAFVIYDPHDRLLFCNERYRELYGISAQIIEPGCHFEDIVRHGLAHGQYPQALGREEEWLRERIAAHRLGNADYIQEITGKRWVNVKERRTPTGHIVGFRVDVTEIYRAKEAAEAADRAKSEFIANMSHEIRTPMNALLGLTQWVLDTPLEPRQKEFLDKALHSGRALLRILDTILDYSKIEAGRMDIERMDFSVADVLGDIANLFAAQLAGKGLEFFVEISPAVPAQVVGDPLRLHQVLSNLVGNAIKFTERGEIRIRVAAEAGADAGQLVLHFSVQDSGIGIAAATAPQLFEAFSQADSSTTRRFGGTGLGLTICQRLVGLMGGEISASGSLGVGATFRFNIVVGRASEQRSGAEEPPILLAQKSALALRRGKAGAGDSDAHLDGEAIAGILRRLKPFLDEHEVVPDDLLQALDELAQAGIPGAAFAHLLQQIDAFNHAEARATLERVAAHLEIPLNLST